MDYYDTLGIDRSASSEDIKKAYRKMAMKHHPDRGGDELKFKKINEAYETLTDPQKKRMVDSGIDPNNVNQQQFHRSGPFEFHFNGFPQDMEEVFQHTFGFGFQQTRRNKSYNINVSLTLEEVLVGKELTAEIGLPNGQKKMITINIPAGIEHGQQIKYHGMGDDSIKGIQPGDLIVSITVAPHSKFQRDGKNLIMFQRITVWEALLGGNFKIETLDKKILDINIPVGTQPDTVLSCKGEGLPDMNTKVKGNLMIKMIIDVPKNLTDRQKELLLQVQQM